MKRIHFVKLLFVAVLVCGSLNAWGAEVTLSNANIVSMGNASTSYNTYSATIDGYSWKAYAIKNYHSKATNTYHYLQIKKYASNTAYYIQLPTFAGAITSISMTVSSTSQPMSGGRNSATLYFSSSKSTSATGTGVASGSGGSSVTIDCSSLGLKTGYITASGAVRVWEVTVTYESGSGETTPSITQHPESATYDQGAMPAALTITADGNPAPTYQWYSNTSNNNSNGTKISGATEASYTPSTATAGTFYYYCVATNSKGSASSNVATITVNTVTTCTVQWMVGGNVYTEGNPTTSVASGSKVSTLPTRPANNAIGSCADTFMGWSAHNLGSKTGQDAPKDLFTTAEGSPVITQDTIFYAVFATGTTN